MSRAQRTLAVRVVTEQRVIYHHANPLSLLEYICFANDFVRHALVNPCFKTATVRCDSIERKLHLSVPEFDILVELILADSMIHVSSVLTLFRIIHSKKFDVTVIIASYLAKNLVQ